MRRRTFLAVAAGIVVTAGGSKAAEDEAADRTSAPADARDDPPTPTTSDFVVVQRYPNTSLTAGTVRLPVSIASSDAKLLTDGPERLTGTLRDSAGKPVAPLA